MLPDIVGGAWNSNSSNVSTSLKFIEYAFKISKVHLWPLVGG
ncbi:unnamed protein product, partial [Rotaria sp. Silwood1]